MIGNRNDLGRRDFLKIVAAAGALGVTAKLGLSILSAPAVVEETRVLMGTVVNLTVYGVDHSAVKKAVESCFSRMQGLESVFSRYRSDSQLSRLNQRSELSNPAQEFVEVIESALTIGHRTEGAFDITVKPVLDLYQRYHREGKGLPPQQEVHQKLSFVDYRKVLIRKDSLKLIDLGMAITLDGIAKGYIIDRGVEILREQGYENILVEAGGDLSAAGQKSTDMPWEIGILSPREDRKEFSTRVAIRNRALATSGDYMQSFSEDRRYHHIIDPQCGYSSPALASVSVIASSGMLADGYATAVMAMGPDRGRELIKSLPEVEAMMISKSMEVLKTSGFDNFQGRKV